MTSKEVFEFHSNDNLVDEVERGLKKGYWDKALIPELKKRFKEIEKKEKLLKLYKRLVNDWDDLSYKEVCDIDKQIKEIENE